ncbi:MAG: hypothetical protein LBG73_04575 [Spirochaetaceae bacterium]|nr:hypothetical protein [Spirochaetaceae bacterium]
MLSKKEAFDTGIKLLSEMHGLLHDKKVYNNTEETCRILSNMEYMAYNPDRGIAGNILIDNGETIFNKDIQIKWTTRR